MGFDYSSVTRWTRKFDIFSYDLLFVPVHLNGNHWVFSVADLHDRQLECNDSLGVTNLCTYASFCLSVGRSGDLLIY